MLIEFGRNIKLWAEFNPVELTFDRDVLAGSDPRRLAARLGFNKERIAIRHRWFEVLSPSQLVRSRNPDGYYRAIYIQLNVDSGEYYIGKVNRRTWSELRRYQGSGLKFESKFKSHGGSFMRYYIAACASAEETERVEASIVDDDLLADEKCLNLVSGGGGTNKHPSVAETSEKKRQHMKSHPEQYRPMLEATKQAFRSGDTPALRERNRRIKAVMSSEHYREMSSKRFAKWRETNPGEVADAKRKSREAIRTAECQERRMDSLSKWAAANPEKHKAWQEKLVASRTSKAANEKRKASLKLWSEANPDQAKANAHKRAKAAGVARSRAVCMVDLEKGEVLERFHSQHEAARWLVEHGKARNTNCVSSISSVCLRKPCTTGHGYRKKAYGYDWRFLSDIKAED